LSSLPQGEIQPTFFVPSFFNTKKERKKKHYRKWKKEKKMDEINSK